MVSAIKAMAVCTLAVLVAFVFPAAVCAAGDDQGKLYQTVIDRNPRLNVVNGQGEFTILVRRGRVRAYRKDTSVELKLVKTGNVHQAMDDAGSSLLIFAVLAAGGHGTQIVYAHGADMNNSRARLGITVGTLEETATLEGQRALLHERIRNLGADPDSVLLVKSVVTGSVGEQAGLKFGDVIVQVGEVADPSPAQFQRAVFEAREGSMLSLTVLRSSGRQVHQLRMPPIPAPTDPMDLASELARVLTSD